MADGTAAADRNGGSGSLRLATVIRTHISPVWREGEAPGKDAPASYVDYCDKPIPDEQQAAVARCIEQSKPVHTTYRLRVKTARKTAE